MQVEQFSLYLSHKNMCLDQSLLLPRKTEKQAMRNAKQNLGVGGAFPKAEHQTGENLRLQIFPFGGVEAKQKNAESET
jgi:hypothetical protein